MLVFYMSNILRRLYVRTLQLAGHRHAERWLAAVSFIESSVFPIPPDVMLIPMCIQNRSRSFHYAMICTLSSVIGGLAGYAIGYFLYDVIGEPVIAFYGLQEKFLQMESMYAEWGGWIIFAKGLTPFPYKIITILSGVLHLSIPVFIVASIFSRALRFFLVAALLWKYGAPIQAFIEKYLGLLTFAFLVILILGFAALRYI